MASIYKTLRCAFTRPRCDCVHDHCAPVLRRVLRDSSQPASQHVVRFAHTQCDFRVAQSVKTIIRIATVTMQPTAINERIQPHICTYGSSNRGTSITNLIRLTLFSPHFFHRHLLNLVDASMLIAHTLRGSTCALAQSLSCRHLLGFPAVKPMNSLTTAKTAYTFGHITPLSVRPLDLRGSGCGQCITPSYVIIQSEA